MHKHIFTLMIALWLLSMVVLINVYTGIYTANMAVPKLEPTVDTLEQLAASDKFRMTVDKNTDMGFKALVSLFIVIRVTEKIIEYFFKEAQSGPFKVFGDTFRKYPELLFPDPINAIANVIQQNCIYPGVIMSIV